MDFLRERGRRWELNSASVSQCRALKQQVLPWFYLRIRLGWTSRVGWTCLAVLVGLSQLNRWVLSPPTTQPFAYLVLITLHSHFPSPVCPPPSSLSLFPSFPTFAPLSHLPFSLPISDCPSFHFLITLNPFWRLRFCSAPSSPLLGPTLPFLFTRMSIQILCLTKHRKMPLWDLFSFCRTDCPLCQNNDSALPGEKGCIYSSSERGMQMSRPGFRLNLCIEENLMLANENSSEAGRWEGGEINQQHKMNYWLCFHRRLDDKLPLYCSCPPHACKEVPRSWPIPFVQL